SDHGPELGGTASFRGKSHLDDSFVPERIWAVREEKIDARTTGLAFLAGSHRHIGSSFVAIIRWAPFHRHSLWPGSAGVTKAKGTGVILAALEPCAFSAADSLSGERSAGFSVLPLAKPGQVRLDTGTDSSLLILKALAVDRSLESQPVKN